ncbi:glutamate--cysteine ligase [Alphaproteobacteria bacterium]|nr:glutamate--cysteine ligase [Alphaproteobacteria bacterium]
MKFDSIITSKSQLVKWFEDGNKKKKDWRVGTEHEKFAYNYNEEKKCFIPAEYENNSGIEQFLLEIAKSGWEVILEKGKVTALKKDNQSITLEPGGQIELSGAPLEDIHQACKETNTHLKLLKELGKKLNITLIGLGARPSEKTESISWMPKARYQIMKNYMPKKGKHGLDMMLSTCTVQANLDYSDEQDMKNKTLLAVKLQPLITALFANSPLSNGNPNGYLSKRRFFWMNTDPDRCGTLKIAFEDDFSFAKYVDYALSVPMYFIIRNNEYINCAGMSFKDFLLGNLEALPNEQPTFKDWEDHLSTIFTEVRLKKFIEVRGADAGNWRRTCALPAFWVGILYDQNALTHALEICHKWTYNDVNNLSEEVAKQGLKSQIIGNKVIDICKEVINISKEGLKKRNILDTRGGDETQYLGVLEEIIDLEKTPAEQMLRDYEGKWDGNIISLIKELAY